ncbi:MAG TPA: acetate metabolism transcriptional regulator RamB [Gordonia sp. (in: high G+C Gram-positive bacteria)]|uniref:acetate metabolism transcriptional regulator RamB n=2 Tax=Gordonia TaxID=2053 RepID=UPI000FB8D60D|nr:MULTISPECIES: acetate metabolism transcriptional regulator RamB [unclassified Gordonia (in: high G+C Gram-positive bacteria)]RUP39993.1 MAG: XRE family transcriptional regulator [Gordonia sp. (in: high G+C Gram-positive bacteria)]HNP56562.1 acetate metabolism transcriptional regulator RamB [Gordonia sp. (in: high G+C Gram-positive bacteria)]HRC49651.1 acetate metabolism transcriptional regulator RamB [Gordonia sp. (in: high G+C Gram-positive bacteria)]
MTTARAHSKADDARRSGSQYVGSRLKQLRAERGMSQVRLATDLGISASYLNQIEHDTRPLTAAVLGRISEVFGVDAGFFDPQDDIRLVAELREALIEERVGDAESTGTPMDPHELADIVAAHPAIAEAVVNLHRRYRVAADQLAAVTDERGDRSMRGAISAPHEEVRDFFSAHHNYFNDLDVAAEEMVTRMRMHSGDVRTEIANRLETVHGVQIVRRVDLGDDVLHRFDAQAGRLEISAALGPGQRTFKLAFELAYLAYGDLMRELVDDAGFTSDDARSLAMSGLANYFAAAAVMPYEQFHGAAEDFRYDIERLSAFYSVSYETICHRLSTLQRPNLRGIPWSFVRVDRAGNMSKRQSATGFHFSASGGTCPLWNVYETFASPGKILSQVAQMPDGREYFWVARTVERRAARFGQPGKTFAIGLGCELRHAGRVVYSDGLEIGPQARVTPIGSGCRVCERIQCPQRAFPPLGVPLHIDEHRSSISPYGT